jgi:hypothetical protein
MGALPASPAARRRAGPRAGAAHGGLSCSDPLLDTIWRVGRRTVDLCSHDAYIDCPSREQRAWVGDSVVHQLVDLTTNADWALAAWNVELAAMPRADGMLPMAVAGDFASLDRTFIPDWALHWVHALWNLWRYTGATEQWPGWRRWRSACSAGSSRWSAATGWRPTLGEVVE